MEIPLGAHRNRMGQPPGHRREAKLHGEQEEQANGEAANHGDP